MTTRRLRIVLTLTLCWLLLPVGAAAAKVGRVAEFELPPGTRAQALVAGPDGNVWFAGLRFGPGGFTDVVGKVTPRGKVTEFPLGAHEAHVGLSDIAVGTDGNLWFAEGGRPRIGRITTAGQVAEFDLPPGTGPNSIVAGPDGNLWFTDEQGGGIGRVAPSGAATVFPLQGGAGRPFGIAAGADGALWAAVPNAARIVRVATDGSQASFGLPRAGSSPRTMVAGPRASVWFTDSWESTIGRIATDGQATEFPVPGGDHTHALSYGPDGVFWYTDGGGEIGSMTTGGRTAGPACIASCRVPITDLTEGPEGRLWFAAGVEPMEPLTAQATIGTFAPPPLEARLFAPVALKGQRAIVPVRCAWGVAGDRCEGWLRIVGRLPGSPGGPVLLAERRFHLPLGAEPDLALRLSGPASALLAGGDRLRGRATTSVEGGRSSSRRIVLRR